MTKEETKKIIFMISATYPMHYKNIAQDMMMAMIIMWSDIFKNYDSMDIYNATKRYVITSNSGFPPTPSQIIDQLFKASETDVLSEPKAWALVRNAFTSSGGEFRKAFNSLPKTVRLAVGDYNQLRTWAYDTANSESYIRSQFTSAYKSEMAKDIEQMKLNVCDGIGYDCLEGDAMKFITGGSSDEG